MLGRSLAIIDGIETVIGTPLPPSSHLTSYSTSFTIFLLYIRLRGVSKIFTPNVSWITISTVPFHDAVISINDKHNNISLFKGDGNNKQID